MRKDITIVAQERPLRGKEETGRLRRSGLSPATVYGPGHEPVAVTVSPKEVNKILRSETGHNTIFNLDIGGKETTPVMIIDWQHDPVKGSLWHIDMKRIDLEKRIRVKVSVHTHGDPKGVKNQGGQFEFITREVDIECLPDDIPARFDIDVANLMLNQGIRASEIPLSGSMKLVSPPEHLIAHVISLRTSKEADAAATAAEPEVMKKGKKEEPAAEGGDKKKK
jgi:large subunit ribosomal protein L25